MIKYGRSPWGYHMISKAPYNAAKHSSFGIVETVFLQWCGFWLTCKTQTCVQQGNTPMELYFLFCWFLFFLFLQQNTLQYLIMEQTPAMIVRLTCYHAGWHLVDLVVLCSTKPCSFLAKKWGPSFFTGREKESVDQCPAADPGFWSGVQQIFYPMGGLSPKICPKLPENCMILEKSLGQGGWPKRPLDPLLMSAPCQAVSVMCLGWSSQWDSHNPTTQTFKIINCVFMERLSSTTKIQWSPTYQVTLRLWMWSETSRTKAGSFRNKATI